MKFSSLSLLLASILAVDNMSTALAAGHQDKIAPFITTKRSIRGSLRRTLQVDEDEDPPTPDEPEATEIPSVEQEEEDAPSEESIDDEEDDGLVAVPEARVCETESGPTRVSHECKTETAEGSQTQIEDEIDFEVKSDDDKGMCIEVKYKQEIEETTTDMETETKAKFDVCFQQLIEYTKAEGSTDEAYDWVNDVVLQTIDLTAWEDFSEVLTDSSTGLSTFSATTTDGELVTMTFTISPAGDGQGITANSMKADFRLVNFPWIDAGNSYVALLSDVESNLEVEVDEEESDELDEVEEAGEMPDDEEEEPEPTEEAVEEPEPTEEMETPEPTEEMDEPEPTEEEPMDGGDARSLEGTPTKPKDVKVPFASVVDTIGFSPLGKVTWASTAIAETATNTTDSVAVARASKTIQVVATSPPEDSERYLVDEKSSQQIAFSFIGEAAQGSPDIFWDPEAGVDYQVESAMNSGVGVVATSVGIMTGLVSAILLLAF